tara:strand:- start:5574 stop:6653 length:1080 start_codon:yes stop_codon:yes gene_type:complete
MKAITLHNYEAFILDFYEGSLDAVQTELLMDFLEKNPDCKADFESFDNITLMNEETTFSGKEVLFSDKVAFQSTITTDNFEEYSIAFYEGILSPKKEQELNFFLVKNPSFQSIHKTYSAVYLPLETIVFDQKKALLHKEPKIIYAFFKYAAVAAAIIWGIFLINHPDQVYFYDVIKPIAEVELIDEFDIAFENLVATIPKKVERRAVKEIKENLRTKANLSLNETRQQVAQVVVIQEPTLTKVIEVIKIEKIAVIQPDEIEIPLVHVNGEKQIAEVVSPKEEMMIPKKKTTQEYASMGNAALGLIKNDVLKNRPIIEALAEEITTATNDKVKLTAKKGITKRVQEFALEIGEFSISKKY